MATQAEQSAASLGTGRNPGFSISVSFTRPGNSAYPHRSLRLAGLRSGDRPRP